ncbi:PH domain-containing protein [Kribbella sp. NPDC003557]|uniref:PH domain-containing protein n=1 Tax=Kribbella sp. NPDC003557 TaxID=3154449 RepID=UPI0033A9F766
MTFRARVLAFGLAGVVGILAAMVMLSVFDQFSRVPLVVRWAVSVIVVLAVVWRFARVGVIATDDALVLRNVLKDVKVPWALVTDVRVEDGAALLGRTAVPTVETAEREYEIVWLAGYSIGKDNYRVKKQTDALTRYWENRQSGRPA